ncbi:MAG: lipopolysaccharide transport periplasmic protein LptA [Thermodesulfobacteriota bacterium]
MHSCNLTGGRGRSIAWVAAGLLFFIVGVAVPGVAVAVEEQAESAEETTSITADRMDAVKSENRVKFYGNVIVLQKDFTLHSNELTVYYTPDGKDVKEIIAVGGVRIVQPLREATSEKAVYRRGERVLILTGNPVVKQERDRVSGMRIIFYLDEEKSIVEGSGEERVKAVIHPGKSGTLFEGQERE